jgi:hypothetical protein
MIMIMIMIMIIKCGCLKHRFSINRPTKCGKEKSPSDGHCQCEKAITVTNAVTAISDL